MNPATPTRRTTCSAKGSRNRPGPSSKTFSAIGWTSTWPGRSGSENDAFDTTEIYVCVQDDPASWMFDLINIMNLTKLVPSKKIRFCRVIGEMLMEEFPCREFRDRTDAYNISDLLAATGAFLSYGKTDLLVEYWEKANLDNPKIEKIVYAMRNIDYGIQYRG